MKPEISIIPERPEVATEPRRPLTKWEFAELMLRQLGKCAACKTKLYQGETHDDHINPLACGGTNALSNRQLLCRSCHAEKTDKKDKGDAARIIRLKGEKGQRARREKHGSKLKSRGFDKTLRKRMNGKTERRNERD